MRKIIFFALMVLTTFSSIVFAAASDLRIKITVNGKTVTATLDDNPTSRAMDLYDREICYRFDEVLPTEKLTSSNYEIGDLAYRPPRHSFVILYARVAARCRK